MLRLYVGLEDPDYLVKALSEYRSGKRQNAIMAGQAKGLSDQESLIVLLLLTVVAVVTGWRCAPMSAIRPAGGP